MPQAFLSFVGWVGGIIINTTVAIFGPTAGIAILDFGAKLAALQFLTYLSNKLAGKPDLNQSGRANLITVRGTIEHGRIVYGETLLSGVLQYLNSAGSHNQSLYHSIMVAYHEIEDITDMWFDDDQIVNAAIDWSGDGSVDSGDFRGNVSLQNVAYFEKKLGTYNQTASTLLTNGFSEITSQHQGRGIAYFVSRIDYFDGQTQVWSGGAPRNYKALVKGKKVYDPRSDSTQSFGTGPLRLTNSLTWEWSDNPALCLADYLIDSDLGFGESTTRVDYGYVASAANICDGVVYTPVGTDKRFRCNGALSTGDTYEDNIESILSSMNGTLAFINGKWKMRAWGYETPTLSYGDDELAGDLQLKLHVPDDQRYNTVRAVFIDKDRLYQPAQAPSWTASEYLSRDNNIKISKDIQLPMTTDIYQAQRLMAGVLEQSDLEMQAIYPTNYKTMPAEVGGIINFSNTKLAISNQPMRVLRYKFASPGGITLTLKKEDSAAYTDVGTAEYIIPNSTGGYNPPAPGVPAPTSLSITSRPSGIEIAWVPPPARLYEFVDVYASANSYANASLIKSTRNDRYLAPYDSGTVRNFWIQARNVFGEVSTRVPATDTSTYQGTAGVIVIEEPVNLQVDTSSYTFPSTNQIILEGVWSGGRITYTSPYNIDTVVQAAWAAKVAISGGTSGAAVGAAFARALVTVDGSTSFLSSHYIEQYTSASSIWMDMKGVQTFTVPASKQIQLWLDSGRTFSVGGASPAQTHYYKDVLLSLLPQRKVLAALLTSSAALITLSDDISVIDSVQAAYIPSPLQERVLLDTITATDAERMLRNRTRLEQEAISIVDTLMSDKLRNRVPKDTITATDNLIRFKLSPRKPKDTITAVDSRFMLRKRFRTHKDTFTVTDTKVATAVLGPRPSVTPFTVEQSDNGTIVHAGFRFNSDGSIDAQGPGLATFVQINSGEWWAEEPVTNIGSEFEIRCNSIVAGTAWTSQPVSVGSWANMGTNPNWRMARSSMADGPGETSIIGYFEIRTAGRDDAIHDTFNAQAIAILGSATYDVTIGPETFTLGDTIIPSKIKPRRTTDSFTVTDTQVSTRIAAAETPLVTDFVTNHTNLGGSATSRFRFNNDGSIDERTGASYAQIKAGQWWPSEPVTNIGSQYEIRCNSLVAGTAFDTSAAAIGAWVNMGLNPEWGETRTSMPSGFESATGFFEIRPAGGGSVLTSFNATAEVET